MTVSVLRTTACAALTLVAVTVPAASASAAGQSCQGTAVQKCVSLSVANGLWQAQGVITDTAGDGIDVDVRVDEVRIQAYSGGRWVDVMSSSADDADGWHPVQDSGLSLRRTCTELQSHGGQIRAAAHMQWRGDRTGEAWVTGGAVTPTCSG